MEKIRLRTVKSRTTQLQIINEDKIRFKGRVMFYEILGRLSVDLTDMSVMLVCIHESEIKRYRRKIDLYDAVEQSELCKELETETGIDENDIRQDLEKLTDLLEIYREENLFAETPVDRIKKKSKSNKEAISILNHKTIFELIDNLLEKAGVVGDKKLRLALFISAISYKNQRPLHIILQGSANSGKSQLADSIAACLPTSDLLTLTRMTDKSLYYFPSELLHQKLMVVHDFENIDGTSFLALRELQESNKLTLGTTKRDRFGNLVPAIRKIEAKFSSLITSDKIPADLQQWTNALVFQIPESQAQTQLLIESQNRFFSGEINSKTEEDAQATLRSLVELIKLKKVINPFASEIKLPSENTTMRSMHAQFMTLVSQVALVSQFQRKTDIDDRIIVELTDLENTLNLFETYLFKVYDQLSFSIQSFFERLLSYLENRGNKEQSFFTSTEIRNELGYSKIFVYRALDALLKTDFVKITGGHANKGLHYAVSEDKPLWHTQNGILASVKEQVEKLKNQARDSD